MKNNILYSKSLSLVGTNIFNIVVNLWILDVFKSSQTLGFVISVSSISAFICSFIGGYLADTKYSLKIIKLSDIISFVICIVSFFAINSAPKFLIYIIVFLLNINNSLSAPLIKTLIVNVVKKEEIIKFNSSLAILGEIVRILVPLIATYLYQIEIIDIKGAILINAISFLVSFIFIARINEFENKKNTKFIGYLETVDYIKRYKIVMLLLLTGALSNLFLAGFNLLLPVFSVSELNNNAYYGVFLTMESIGALVGTFSTKLLPIDSKIIKERYGIMVSGILMSSLIIWRNFYLLCVLCFILNFFYVRYNIAFQSFIQTDIEHKYIGKTFSISYILSNIALPIGSSLFGYLFTKPINIGITLISIGLTTINLVWVFLCNKTQDKQERNYQ